MYKMYIVLAALKSCSRLMPMDRGPDAKIAEAFNCRVQTIEMVWKRLVMEGFELALEGKKREEPPTPPKLDGKAEANLIALLGQAARGLRTLDVTTARRRAGGLGGGRFDQS
jgi:hypothetical protein